MSGPKHAIPLTLKWFEVNWFFSGWFEVSFVFVTGAIGFPEVVTHFVRFEFLELDDGLRGAARPVGLGEQRARRDDRHCRYVPFAHVNKSYSR